MEDENRVVRITTTFEVHPDELEDPAWEDRIRASQRRLGALAGATSEVRVDLSIKEASEIPVLPDKENLDQDFGKLLLATADTTPQSAKSLAGKLKRHGLSTPRHILAVGTTGLSFINDFAEKSRAYTKSAMQYLDLEIPEAPTPEETAVFCDSLDQVPGLAILLQEIPRREKPMSTPFSLEWKFSDVPRHTIQEIIEKPLEEVASWIITSPYYNPDGTDSALNHKKAIESADALRRVANRYSLRFMTARQAL